MKKRYCEPLVKQMCSRSISLTCLAAKEEQGELLDMLTTSSIVTNGQ